MRLKTLGKTPIRIRKFTDHGPNTCFYGPHVDQSECRILQSHIIINIIPTMSIDLAQTEGSSSTVLEGSGRKSFESKSKIGIIFFPLNYTS